MNVNIDNIPDDMKDAGMWVVWRSVERNGKPTKMPIDVNTGSGARSNDARTWVTFKEAVAYAESHPDIDGLGFMFGDAYTGIDVDHLEEWKRFPDKYNKLMKMVDSAGTYVEYSPSGDGLHLIYKARKPGKRCSRKIESNTDAAFEMWDNHRYFTVTGDKYKNSADYVSMSDEKVKDFYNEFLDEDTQKTKNAVDAIIDDTIHKTDRRQIVRNGYHDKKSNKKFARVPRGMYTCDWCIMLASWGFHYNSQETALSPGHNWCDCAVIAGFADAEVEGYDPDAYYDYYEKNLLGKFTNSSYYEKRNSRRDAPRAPGGGVVMTEAEYLDALKNEQVQAQLNVMSESSKKRLKARQVGNN